MSTQKSSNSRNFISTYLSERDVKVFNSLMNETGLSKAALAKGLIKKTLRGLRQPCTSKHLLELIRLSNR